jgi:hypothetical protein
MDPGIYRNPFSGKKGPFYQEYRFLDVPEFNELYSETMEILNRKWYYINNY